MMYDFTSTQFGSASREEDWKLDVLTTNRKKANEEGELYD